MSTTIAGAWERHVSLPQVSTARARWTAIGLVGTVALCLPAWHVVTGLLSDSYMTLYAGRWIAAHGIPHHEVFTVAARGRAWVDQQWLAELIDYETWRVGGYGVLGLLNALAIASSSAMLAALALRRGASLVLAVACCTLAAIVALPAEFIRAQNLALPLFVVLLALCLTDAEHDEPRRRIVLIVPLLVLWANLHGSVLIGVGLGCAYLTYRGLVMARRGQWMAASGYCALALVAGLTPLATPYGTHIITYYQELIGNPAVAAAAPDNRPPSLSAANSLFFFTPLGLTVAALVKRREATARGRPAGWCCRFDRSRHRRRQPKRRLVRNDNGRAPSLDHAGVAADRDADTALPEHHGGGGGRNRRARDRDAARPKRRRL
ncbi:MAG: hypothetical protein ACRDNK_18660 [Solirubrobacteraceae bacterium]